MSTRDEARRAELGAHVLHVRADRAVRESGYAELLGMLGEVTPVVQPLPPAAALANVAGALRYWDRTPYELAQRIRARALAAGLFRADRCGRHLGGRGGGLRASRPWRHPRRP
ncbi:hypothetical protein OIE69_42945 [Actinacidiphila glaucinigra]|uniref:hypothetical protein n=1 Tax=Actinacidiphila glaucinigra TaxID=235986 RepID=UPI002DDB0115|nr:hypothetical protein [Actinacidiphila glaucinigra]WSD57499.1 hypothetical protein OIE69_00275 [Actinacidiphila glaucinigra]WSD65146.1 hypothetical protein OIE69_42945 [Actinacidiphila glaucinigra]